MRQVCENDLRLPEFRDVRLDELEFRDDGKVVRKDRWETGMFSIMSKVAFALRDPADIEIADIVEAVNFITGRLEACECALRKVANEFGFVYVEGATDPSGLPELVKKARWAAPSTVVAKQPPSCRLSPIGPAVKWSDYEYSNVVWGEKAANVGLTRHDFEQSGYTIAKCEDLGYLSVLPF